MSAVCGFTVQTDEVGRSIALLGKAGAKIGAFYLEVLDIARRETVRAFVAWLRSERSATPVNLRVRARDLRRGAPAHRTDQRCERERNDGRADADHQDDAEVFLDERHVAEEIAAVNQ